MQVHGGIGYSRHKPFEHIYRHHRRYRITEGSEEIQMRKVGAFLFGYLGPQAEGDLQHRLGGGRLPRRRPDPHERGVLEHDGGQAESPDR